MADPPSVVSLSDLLSIATSSLTTISLRPSALDKVDRLSSLALVSRQLSPKQVFSNVLRRIIVRNWGLSSPVEVTSPSHNVFLLVFVCETDRKMVLEMRPWNIHRCHLVLQQWCPGVQHEDMDLFHTMFWFRVFGLPLDYLNEENATLIGSALGSLESIDCGPKGYWPELLALPCLP